MRRNFYKVFLESKFWPRSIQSSKRHKDQRWYPFRDRVCSYWVIPKNLFDRYRYFKIPSTILKKIPNFNPQDNFEHRKSQNFLNSGIRNFLILGVLSPISKFFSALGFWFPESGVFISEFRPSPKFGISYREFLIPGIFVGCDTWTKN